MKKSVILGEVEGPLTYGGSASGLAHSFVILSEVEGPIPLNQAIP